MHITVFKLTKIYFAVGPKILPFSLFDSVDKVSNVLTPIRIHLHSLVSMWLAVQPKTRILEAIVEKKSTETIFFRMVKGATIKGAICINENVVSALSLTLVEPTFEVTAIWEIHTSFSMRQSIQPLANIVYFFVKNKKTGKFVTL